MSDPHSSRNNGRNTRRSPPVEHQFKLGNPGRPRGSRNKLSEAFVSALQADFAEHGHEAIAICRRTQPSAYLRVIAYLLPKDVNVTTRSLDDLSDDQLMRKLAVLTEMARPLLAKLRVIEGQAVEVKPAE